MKLISKILISAGVALASLSASAGTVVSKTGENYFGADGAAMATAAWTATTTTTIPYYDWGSRSWKSYTTETKSSLGSLTLGLSAVAHGGNPAVTNDGEGNFHAVHGADKSSILTNWMNLARWDIDFDLSADLYAWSQEKFFLKIDIDPTAGTNFKSFEIFSNGLANAGDNLFIEKGNFVFDPGTAGSYNIELVAINRKTGAVDASAAIVVDVPEPASLALVGLALVGVGFASRRRKV